MYQGNNPIAIQSRDWIVVATVALMGEKTYKQITVRDICIKADLSRQTFYNIFETKEDVLRFCMRTHYEELYSRLSHKDTLSLDDIIYAFSEELRLDSKLIQLMIESDLEGLVSDEIARCVELFAGHFSRRSKDDRLLSYEEAFFSGALSRLLLHWFKAAEPVNIEELVQIIVSVCSGKLIVDC
jgi:AcrR family transcriptional regulator